jgi:hypothetical protein
MPRVQEEGPSVEIYCSFKEVWAGVSDILDVDFKIKKDYRGLVWSGEYCRYGCLSCNKCMCKASVNEVLCRDGGLGCLFASQNPEVGYPAG